MSLIILPPFIFGRGINILLDYEFILGASSFVIITSLLISILNYYLEIYLNKNPESFLHFRKNSDNRANLDSSTKELLYLINRIDYWEPSSFDYKGYNLTIGHYGEKWFHTKVFIVKNDIKKERKKNNETYFKNNEKALKKIHKKFQLHNDNFGIYFTIKKTESNDIMQLIANINKLVDILIAEKVEPLRREEQEDKPLTKPI